MSVIAELSLFFILFQKKTIGTFHPEEGAGEAASTAYNANSTKGNQSCGYSTLSNF